MFFAKLRKNMRWIIIVIVAAFALGGTLYMGTGADNQQMEAGPPLAEVNGRPISRAQFQQAYANNVRMYSQFFGPIQGQMAEEVMYASLQDLIIDSLVRAAAQEAALPVSAQEIDSELADIKAGFPDDATYRQVLAQSGLTEKQLRELLSEELSIQKLEQSVRDRAQLSEDETESLDEESVEALQRTAEDEQVRLWLQQLRERAVIEIHDPQLRAYDLVTQGRHEEAVEQYKLAMVTDPFNPYLHVSLGAIYEQLGQAEDALAAYETAAEMNDADAMLHVHLALAYRDAERTEDAVAELRTAAEMNPWDAQLQFMLMQIFTEMELPDDARAAAERLDELDRLQAELQQPPATFELLDESPAEDGGDSTTPDVVEEDVDTP